jgi:enoyl-[acyl-carrier-protein] reductase (NADH)
MTGLMAGKRGLIMGLANEKSLAWGIAKALHAQGAEMAFSFQGEALEKRVRSMSRSERWQSVGRRSISSSMPSASRTRTSCAGSSTTPRSTIS